ncbi:hypothetical protein KCU95_g15015, partial [Aureobasidium melanogenum]
MSWPEPLELAIKLYNDGDSEACVALVNSILTDTLPLYPHVCCSILLAHSLEGWDEAELRGLLDDLAEELRSWRLDDWYEHQLFWADADAEDRDAAITKALEDWFAEQAEGEEGEGAKQAESDEENIAKQAEGEDEEFVEQVEGEEEVAAEQAEGKE